MLDHNAAHFGVGRNDRRGLRYFLRSYFRRYVIAIEDDQQRVRLTVKLNIHIRCDICGHGTVRKVDPAANSGERDRPVHCTRIEIEKAQLFRKHLPERRFACSGRPVYRDDHERFSSLRCFRGSFSYTSKYEREIRSSNSSASREPELSTATQ